MKRKSKIDRSPTSAIGIVEIEREAAHRKTMRLRAERQARDEAEAEAKAKAAGREAAPPAPKPG